MKSSCSACATAGSSCTSTASCGRGTLARFNHRTTRKLLTCDGAVGYTFGHGFADLWLGDGEDEHHARDTGIRIEGPAVTALQSVFMENWIEESRRVPSGDGCFPTLESRGDCDAHVVSSASGDAVSSVALLYTVAIACARREVIIQKPLLRTRRRCVQAARQ